MTDTADWLATDRLITGADVSDTSDWTFTDRAVPSSDVTDAVDFTESETGAAGAATTLGPPGAWVSSSLAATTGAGSTTLAVGQPISVGPGDLLVCFFHTYTGASTPAQTPDANFTLVPGLTATSAVARMSIYTHTVTISDPASYTFTCSPAAANLLAVIAWTGLATGTDGGAVTVTTTNPGTWTSLSFTAGHAADIVLLGAFGLAQGNLGPGPLPSSFLGEWVAPAVGAHLGVFSVVSGASATVPAYTGQFYDTGGSQMSVGAVALH